MLFPSFMKKTIILMLAGAVTLSVIACKPKCESKDECVKADATEQAAAGTCEAKADGECAAISGEQLAAEYQKFADEYLAAFKKFKAGDLSAAQDFKALGEKALEWAKKLQEAAGKLTEEEMQKLVEIKDNLAKAME